jgi:hypothetical protein
MPAASRHDWKSTVLFVLAVCVCIFALRAKLSLYDPPHPGMVNPATASKLWVGGEKGKTAIPSGIQVLRPTAFVTAPRPVREVVLQRNASTLVPHYLRFPEFNRLLRPPPTA